MSGVQMVDVVGGQSWGSLDQKGVFVPADTEEVLLLVAFQVWGVLEV